VYENLVT